MSGSASGTAKPENRSTLAYAGTRRVLNCDDTPVSASAYANVERFLGFAVPDAEPDITDITTGGFDVFMAFERISGTITIQGVDYKVWRSRVIQNDRASGVLYSFTQ